jgi:hypothetical protein
MIRTTIQREASQENNTTKLQPGRLYSLSEEQRDHLYEIFSHVNPYIKMRDLLREVKNDCKTVSSKLIMWYGQT